MKAPAILAVCLRSRQRALCRSLSSASRSRPAQNVVVNGDFAKFNAQENLWDGVDGQNFLAGDPVGAYAVTESGKVGSLPMPLSVNFVDMNGDKLPDIVTAIRRESSALHQ